MDMESVLTWSVGFVLVIFSIRIIATLLFWRLCRRKARTIVAVDGDSITLDGSRCRLFGIDAPEMPGVDGRVAAFQLRLKIQNATRLEYLVQGRCRYGRRLVTLLADGEDLNAWMVGQGYARAYARYSSRYWLHQLVAGIMRRGFWRDGWFTHPEKLRRARA